MRYLTLALLAAPTLLSAQLKSVSPGTRIRVTAPSMIVGRVEGLLVDATADSLILTPQSGVTFRLPNTAVRRVEVRRRTRAAGAKKFGFWFGVATLPFGLVMGGVAGGGCDYSNPETVRLANADSLRFCPRNAAKTANVLGVAGIAAISGALEGALIGAIIRAPSWEPVQVPLRVSSSRQGLRIGTSIGF